MISAFLPLILLAYGTVEWEGAALFIPATGSLLWLWSTLVVLRVLLPDWLSGREIDEDGPGISFLTALALFQWGSAAWILLLQMVAAPGQFLAPWLSRTLPQAWPTFLSAALYVWMVWTFRTTFQQAYRLLLNPDQTPEEFFRARMTLPILFFPPMLAWMVVEDLWLEGGTFSGFSDLGTFILAPLFFLTLYLLAPHLFNFAWRAAPMGDADLRARIIELAGRAETPISGVKVWDTFKEPVPNAAVAGLSRRFRFVYITQYLLDLFPPRQILSIVAHELGHLRLGHVWTYLIFSLDLVFLSLWVKLELMFRLPWTIIRFQSFESMMDLVVFMVVFLCLFTALTRRSEFEADAFSASFTGGEVFASTLRTLEGFITPPHPWMPRWLLTHPEFADRIREATSWQGPPEELVRNARVTRGLLIGLGVVLLLFSWPAARQVLGLAQAHRAVERGEIAGALAHLRDLAPDSREHPMVLEILARAAVRQNRWPLAVYLAAAYSWENWLRLGPPLEVFQHAAAPEVAFDFQIVQFLLQPLDLRGVHGVSLFDEVFDHIQIPFGQR